MSALNDIEREMAELELALLRRGVDDRAAGQECCTRCRRSPLIGEWVYTYERDRVLCELCRSLSREAPTDSRLVHTPAFGSSLRILDQRAA
ncbi:MAG: hypothetical protein ACJ764_08910 [Solirubrobacteraceae bacterium]